MPVRFVIGRAGSGKTSRALAAIAAAMRDDPLGPPIFFIVPRQTTFAMQRWLACESGLSGFCRARVLTFDDLASAVLAECGGDAVPLVTELGRRMLLGHLLRTHESELQHYRSVALLPGLAAELEATFTEMERCGKSAGDLSELAAALDPGHSLIAKLHDLALLYNAYSAYLGQERIDQHRRMTQVIDSLRHCSQLRGASVYVDGFLEFTDYDRRMLAGLAQTCPLVEISLLLDPQSKVLNDPHALPDEMELFHRTWDAHRRLWFALTEAGIEFEPAVMLPEMRRAESAALRRVEQWRWDGASREHGDSDLDFIEAPDRRSEVDAAARRICSLVAAGYRYRDIAVLARSVDEYAELVTASFAEHGIPLFIDRRRTAAHHPLLQTVRAAVQLAAGGWSTDALLTIARSGLGSLSPDQADELENYALMHRLPPQAWASSEPWAFRRDLSRREDDDDARVWQSAEAAAADALRRRLVDPAIVLVDALAKRDRVPVRTIVLELFALLDRLNVRGILVRWMSDALANNDVERHDEHQRVWDELCALCDQMVDVLGDEPVTIDQFVQILEAGLEQFDLALTPPMLDQVLVGEMERSRNFTAGAVILLGMNEGSFPRATSEDSILSDAERRTLDQRKLTLNADSQRRLLDEELLAYIAMTRASKKLVLTRSLADDEGRPQGPSVYWKQLRDLFPDTAVDRPRREYDAPIDQLGTPRQIVSALMRWVRKEYLSDDMAAAYQWLATEARPPIAGMRQRAWPALSYSNDARLSATLIAALRKSPLRASVSRLEAFANCPYRHFVQYDLRLEARDDPEVTPLDLGNVYHAILERVVKQLLADRSDFAHETPQRAAELIHTFAAKIGKELRGEIMLSTARNKYLLGRIERTLEKVMAAHRAMSRRSKLRPWRAELTFGGGDSELPPLVLDTPAGATLELHGKIDRVDFVADQAAFAVIDYKTSEQKLDLQRVYHGLSLQLLTYLLVLQASGEKLAGRKLTPIAAFYVQLLRKLDSVDHPADAPEVGDRLFDLGIRPRGVIDGRHIHTLDTELSSGRSEVVSAHVKAGGGFGYKGTTDIAEADEFEALLRRVRTKLGELGDQILRGDISVHPFWLNGDTPCMYCDFRSVCRFDAALNPYHTLTSMDREAALARVVEEAGGER